MRGHLAVLKVETGAGEPRRGRTEGREAREVKSIFVRMKSKRQCPRVGGMGQEPHKMRLLQVRQESYPKILKSREGPLVSLSEYKEKEGNGTIRFVSELLLCGGETRTAEDSLATK